MSFWREVHIKKTRKEHKCDGCLEIIPKGSQMIYWAGKWEGEFQTNRLCIPCKEFLDKNYDLFEEGFCLGDIGRERIEMNQAM